VAAEPVEAAPAPVTEVAVQIEAAPAQVETAPLETAQAVETVAVEPVAEVVAEPVLAEVPVIEPVAAPVIEAPVAAIDLSATLEASGLVLIETRSEAIQAFQNDVPAEPAQPVRRRRRAAATVVDEPLIQVETGPK
jgi:hypothetical protein